MLGKMSNINMLAVYLQYQEYRLLQLRLFCCHHELLAVVCLRFTGHLLSLSTRLLGGLGAPAASGPHPHSSSRKQKDASCLDSHSSPGAPDTCHLVLGWPLVTALSLLQDGGPLKTGPMRLLFGKVFIFIYLFIYLYYFFGRTAHRILVP